MLATAVLLLAVAAPLAALAARVGLGAIVGYLAAGIVVGPWVTGAVTEVATIAAVSELGVVLMLFVVGLELEPRRLLAMRRQVFGAGALQVVACGGVLAALALLAGLGPRPALLVGLALALSSTAIGVQVMTERNLLGTPAGHTAFGILLFQDLAAIPLVALAALLASASVPAHAAQPLWVSLSALAAVIVLGRLLMRPLFRAVASIRLREVFTITALLLVLSVAWLMHWAGLSMALGAFVAGVLLADSEYRTALETDIEPFKGLLLGLFFVSVGMSLDLGVLATQWHAVGVVALALFGAKAAVIAALARWMEVARSSRLAFALILAQGGEFAFVVLGAARTSGLLSDADASVLNSAIAVSMALTPIALSLAERVSARRQSAAERPADAIEGEGPVIIAGFGRVGQIVGRLLLAHGIRATVLDHDPDQIEFLRKYGYQVFFGDATRLDLLATAGAARAALLVVAIDDVDDSLAIVDLARRHFPGLRILARARNVRHLFELRRRGVSLIERETFESSLRMGRLALETLGVEPHVARQGADRFRRHNRASLDAMYSHYGDDERMQSAARSARRELEESMRRERELSSAETQRGWG